MISILGLFIVVMIIMGFTGLIEPDLCVQIIVGGVLLCLLPLFLSFFPFIIIGGILFFFFK